MGSDKINLKSVIMIGDQQTKTSAIDKKVKEDGSVYIVTPTTGFDDKRLINHKSQKSDIISFGEKGTQAIELSSCNNKKNSLKKEIEQVQGRPEPLFPGYGIVITLISSAIFSISTACVKGAGIVQPGIDGVTLAFSRGLIMCFLTGFIQLSRGENLYVPKGEILVNVLRSLFGTGAIFGLYISMKYITLGDATAISFSSPVWTYILSHFILKEKINWIQIVSLPASIFGVLLIANPFLFISVDGPDKSIMTDLSKTTEELLNDGLYPNTDFFNNITTAAATTTTDNTINSNILMTTHKFNVSSFANTTTMQDNPINQSTNLSLLEAHSQDSFISGYDPSKKIYGIILAVMSSFSMAGAFIVLKFRKKTPVPTTIFWFGLTTSSMAFVLMSSYIGFNVPSSLNVWLLILTNGILSFIGQSFFQVAFYYEDASIISLVKTVEVVMAFIITMLFFDDYIEWTSIVGALIIVTSVVSLMLLKWYKSQKATTQY